MLSKPKNIAITNNYYVFAKSCFKATNKLVFTYTYNLIELLFLVDRTVHKNFYTIVKIHIYIFDLMSIVLKILLISNILINFNDNLYLF